MSQQRARALGIVKAAARLKVLAARVRDSRENRALGEEPAGVGIEEALLGSPSPGLSGGPAGGSGGQREGQQAAEEGKGGKGREREGERVMVVWGCVCVGGSVQVMCNGRGGRAGSGRGRQRLTRALRRPQPDPARRRCRWQHAQRKQPHPSQRRAQPTSLVHSDLT